MIDSISAAGIAVLSIVAAFAALAAMVLGAMAAALGMLTTATAREIALARRQDGTATVGSRIVVDEAFPQAVAVGFVAFESIFVVSFSAVLAVVGLQTALNPWLALAVALVGSLIVALYVIRAVPRRIAAANPEGSVKVLAGPSRLLTWLTAPVRAVSPTLSVGTPIDPEALVEQASDALEDRDAELLRSVVELGDTLTREVMVPRTDMITIESGTSVRKAMNLFMRSGFSRVPVVGGDVDDLLGVVYLKDVVAKTWDDDGDLERPVDDFLRPPVFVPESVPVDDLLRRMQDEVFHMAVVVDEFGGVAGVVTIEDAIEEIVGEVVDEHDAAVPDVEELSPGVFRVPARYPIDEVGELYDLDIDDDDVDTVGGLLSKALGKVPIPGAHASAYGIEMTAERTEGRRRRLTTIVVRKAVEDEDD